MLHSEVQVINQRFYNFFVQWIKKMHYSLITASLYKNNVRVSFTVVRRHVALSLKQTNGIIKHVFPVVRQLYRETYVWSENTTTTPFKASASPGGFISHTFELSQRDTFLKIQTFPRGCMERREVRLSSSPLLSYRGKQLNMNLESPAILSSIIINAFMERREFRFTQLLVTGGEHG